MKNINDKIDGDPGPNGELPADEFNDHKNELQNAVESTGQTLTPGSGTDVEQFSKALANTAAGLDYYEDAGIADNYILNPVSPAKGITTLEAGWKIRFKPANANTGPSVANVNSLGPKALENTSGGPLSGGELAAGVTYPLEYNPAGDGGSGAWVVSTTNITPGSVGTTEIQDGAVTFAKLAPDAQPSFVGSAATPPDVPYADNTTLTFAHGLGVEPDLVVIKAICTVAQAGYAPGEVLILSGADTGTAFGSKGFVIEVDSVNTYVHVAQSGMTGVDKTPPNQTFDLTPGSWDIRARSYA